MDHPRLAHEGAGGTPGAAVQASAGVAARAAPHGGQRRGVLGRTQAHAQQHGDAGVAAWHAAWSDGAWLPVGIPGLGGRGDALPIRGHRDGLGSRHPERCGGCVQAGRSVREAAGVDAGVGGLSGQGESRGRGDLAAGVSGQPFGMLAPRRR